MIIYPLAALATWLGLIYLAEAAHLTGTSDYAALAASVFGPWGSFWADASLVVSQT